MLKGRKIIYASWAATVISIVSAAVSASTGKAENFAVSAVPGLVMFSAGMLVFLFSFVVAVGRSRFEEIAVLALYGLSGCAPKQIQRVMLSSVALQSVATVAIAIVRPFTLFSVLAPMFTLGLCGLWGALHGTFEAKDRPDSRP